MGENLERDLGLYSVVTVSMGAMIGSGIFVLPAIGYKVAGPAVIGAYLLAGIIVLPAALSKAEMATAMPESGGTYLYIDRALGPLAGTIAGIGAWFSLVFKSSFALVGLGAYLLLFVDIPASLVTPIAMGLGVLVVLLNIVGTKESGNVQAIIVTFVVAVLGLYVLNGSMFADVTRFEPFVTHGNAGIITATAFVFVSYAGVTKVASVAEEVAEPETNLPKGILISIAVMMVLYTAVVGAIVGLSDQSVLLHGGPNGGPSITPMADGASALFGGLGVLVISIVAVLALTSMANAGVLASSRFPLAMSRDALLPGRFAEIDPRFTTPRNAVVLTGVVLIGLIAFVPVVELAKLASAFQILVFAIVNLAVIAFRESDVEFYQPSFHSPGYPYVQILGVIAQVALLTQMGTVPILGAAGIVAFGVVWYFLYGRHRIDRVGAISVILDRRNGSRSLSTEDITPPTEQK
ncbi:MAG: APC family permease [Halobacteriota archaeon]